jgi:hypothetical protein
MSPIAVAHPGMDKAHAVCYRHGPCSMEQDILARQVRTLRSICHAQLLEDSRPSLQNGILRFELPESLFKGATQNLDSSRPI